MKILVITSLNPALNQDPFQLITRTFSDRDDISVLSYPFFAEMRAIISNKQYVPVLFAMLKSAALVDELREKLFDKKHTIVIGNSYKDEKFDYIIAYRDEEIDDKVFDSYIHMLSEDKDMKTLLNLSDLYSVEDAEITLPTTSHLKLFLEEVLKDE